MGWIARGSGGWVTGLLALATGCRETVKVRATERAGRSCVVDLRRFWPFSNTIARSSWRVVGVRQPTVGERKSAGAPPTCTALSQAQTITDDRVGPGCLMSSP